MASGPVRRGTGREASNRAPWPVLDRKPAAEPYAGVDGDSRSVDAPAPTVCLVGGTRPEGLKLGPVVVAMIERGRLSPLTVASGQHPTMFHQAIEAFDLHPDIELNGLRQRGGQAELVSLLLPELDAVLAARRPAAVVVQGDTSTTLAAALTAFWRGVPVVHLEAGLRSWNLAAPFPEEGNRRLVAQISSLHLAPTPTAVRNLATDGIHGPYVLSIGNTVVDAALTLSNRPAAYSDDRLAKIEQRAAAERSRLALVTVHRRESWGAPLRRVLTAVAELVRILPDLEIVLPAHPNPVVRDDVLRILGGEDRVTVTEPLPYVDLIRLLKRASLVLSDSGGIQEEVASFGVPVLVLREVTERTEAVEAGFATLVGTDEEIIIEQASRLLRRGGTDDTGRSLHANPFGDGWARYRAEEAIAWTLGLQPDPPAQFLPAGTADVVAIA